MDTKCDICNDFIFYFSHEVTKASKFRRKPKVCCAGCYTFFAIFTSESPPIPVCKKANKVKTSVFEEFSTFNHSKHGNEYELSLAKHEDCSFCRLRKCRFVGMKPKTIDDADKQEEALLILLVTTRERTLNQMLVWYPESYDVTKLVVNALIHQNWSKKETHATWDYFRMVTALIVDIFFECTVITRFIAKADLRVLRQHNKKVVFYFLLFCFLTTPTAHQQLNQFIALDFVIDDLPNLATKRKLPNFSIHASFLASTFSIL